MRLKFSFLKFILFFIIFISFVVTLNLLLKRLAFEKANTTINTILPFSHLKQLAILSGKDIKAILPQIKPAIVSISIAEDTLQTFVDEGKLTVLKGSEVMNLYRVGHLNRHILTYLYNQVKVQPDHFYLIVEEKEDYERIRDFLTLEFGNEQVKRIGRWNILEVVDDASDLFKIGLGISDQKVKSIVKSGFKPVFVFKNSHRLSAPLLRLKLSSVQKHLKNSLIYFEDKSILGYPHELINLENKLNHNHIGVANIEFYQPAGFQILSQQIPYHLIKTHRVPDKELKHYNANKLILRYVRSIKERGAKAIIVSPLFNTFNKKNILETNLAYFNDLKDKILSIDYTISPIQRLNFDSFTSAEPWEIFVISLGVFSGLLCLLSYFFMINIFFFILYFVLGASLFLMAHLSDALLLWSSGVAFVCAVTFPSLAIVSQFPNQKDSQSIQHRFFASFFYFILIIAISLVGACFIVTLLSDISFIQSVRSFSGVKLSYILPIFIIGLFFFLRPERLSSTFYVFKRVLFSPIHTVSLIAIISCVLFMVVLILRSGHFFDILILDFEQSLRFFFEQHLFVRPRIKEILIGYPFLLITFIYIDTLISRYWSWFFLILGAVAPISIINSFCHIHTPLYVTLYRTLLGFILGIIFGLMYLILFKFISQIYKRYT